MDIIMTHHLEGKVAFVNITSQAYLAASYRYFASRHSVFTLTALYEPFGLAPIEAMAAGLPVAVTKYGGPSEVLKDEENTYGVLLDVKDIEKMIQGYIHIFKHYDFYYKQGLRRVLETYNWDATATVYEQAITEALKNPIESHIIPKYFMDASTPIDQADIIESYYLKDKE
jgi:sucrose-phosphate synthase